ncbi:MAG: LuxS protein involved in autoinducer synthesis [Clostridia bacterium]|nr:LuxS protein involved in autoinducer synthesis [Clostridia bacterium]
METIASFEVDHTKLKPGIYISRIDTDIKTYDLRVTAPNKEFLGYGAIHTVEHLFAVHARNGKYGKNIVYFGPMGCRTGFYLLTREFSDEEALMLIKETILYISQYPDDNSIPGQSEKECGNYLEHDLKSAKKIASDYFNIIKGWKISDLAY